MTIRHIALLAYPAMTALDLIGPHHILSMLPDVRVHLVAKTREPITSDLGLVITPSLTFDECPQQLEVLFTPGGTSGTLAAMQDEQTLSFLRTRGRQARWVTSVCTGSLLLGAAGLLQGRRATSHWVARDLLAHFGAVAVARRVVSDGNILTGAGVTAGLDFALTLAATLSNTEHARRIQLVAEYDPDPPFDAGSTESAGEATTDALRQMLAPFLAAATEAAVRWVPQCVPETSES
jgi:cyclohexyl-isocyanide hydratase